MTAIRSCRPDQLWPLSASGQRQSPLAWLILAPYPGTSRRTLHPTKTLRSRGANSAPKLDLRELTLPWAQHSIGSVCGRRKSLVAAADAAVVCSKGANASSGPGAPRAVIAARLANRPPAAGGVGMPAAATAPRTTAGTSARNKAAATANAAWRAVQLPLRRRRPEPPRRARASAQQNFPKMVPASPVTGPVATRSLSRNPVRRRSVFAVRPAVRLCVASATVKRVGVGGSVRPRGLLSPTADRHRGVVKVSRRVLQHADAARYFLPHPKTAEGSGRARYPRPPVLLLGMGVRAEDQS